MQSRFKRVNFKGGNAKSLRRWLIVCWLLSTSIPAVAEYFNIPAQSLNTALKAIAQQSGLQIFSSHSLTHNIKSQIIAGEFSNEQALSQLLRDSGLTYKKIRTNVFVIVRQEPLPEQKNKQSIDRFQIEEMVITSRKRTETIQNSPISVTAITETDIEQLNLSDVPELSHIVPNFTIVPSPPISGNSAAAGVYIRGIGQLDFTINVDPGVGTYVDGVYLARSVGSIIDLIDLDRIEILRGPQGTLFGRNTIGGAVRLMSKAPTAKPNGKLAVTIGEDQRVDLRGIANVPVNENVLSKVSLLRRKRDGYVIDGNGRDLGNDNSTALRSQLLWQGESNLQARLIVDWTRDRENGSPNTAINLFSSGQLPDRVNNAPQGEARNAGCQPELHNVSRLCFGPAWLTGNKNKTESTFLAKSDNDIFGVSLTLNYDLQWGALKSITAWRDLESEFQRDSDHTPFNVFSTANEQQQNQFSQELQLLGDNFSQSLQWVSGIYYLEEEATEFTRVSLPDPSGQILNGLFDHNAKNTNWAIYGETTYDLTKALQLTFGTRYTAEKKYYASQQFFVAVNNPTSIELQLVDEPGQSRRFKELTSRVTLALDLSQQLMSYATVSNGFKSGGFNSRHLAPAPNLRAISYEPEYVIQYEIGAKFHNKENTLLVNGAAFHGDYDDIQISTNPDFTNNATITQNAAKADISGMELEIKYAPTPQWLIETGIGYLNAAYKMLDDGVAIDVGNEFAWVPQWSGSFALSHITSFKNGTTLTPRLGISRQSKTQGTAENEEDVAQSGYSRVDLNILLNTTAQHWSLSFGVSNLTDRKYLISANQNLALGYAEGVFSRGREWYVKATKYF